LENVKEQGGEVIYGGNRFPELGKAMWWLVEIAGKVIRHGRQLILKLAVPLEKLEVLLKIRELCLEFG